MSSSKGSVKSANNNKEQKEALFFTHETEDKKYVVAKRSKLSTSIQYFDYPYLCSENKQDIEVLVKRLNAMAGEIRSEFVTDVVEYFSK